jgi:hypothetical protein
VTVGLLALAPFGFCVAMLLRPAPLHVKSLGLLWFGGMGGSAVAALLHYARRLGWRVRLHERGLVLIRGGRVDEVPWDAVAQFYETTRLTNLYGTPWGEPDRRLRLVTEAGLRCPLDRTFSDLATLADAVSEGVQASLRRRAEGQLGRGEGVRFGALTVSADGITVGTPRARPPWETLALWMSLAAGITVLRRGSIPWPEVESIRVEAEVRGPQAFHRVVIRRRGRRKPQAACPVPEFPNFALFLRVVDALGQAVQTA